MLWRCSFSRVRCQGGVFCRSRVWLGLGGGLDSSRVSLRSCSLGAVPGRSVSGSFSHVADSGESSAGPPRPVPGAPGPVPGARGPALGARDWFRPAGDRFRDFYDRRGEPRGPSPRVPGIVPETTPYRRSNLFGAKCANHKRAPRPHPTHPESALNCKRHPKRDSHANQAYRTAVAGGMTIP